jgi:GNAT superfamily N-acetyltransferase
VIRIRPMTVADLPLGLHLVRQAGWNQVEADWKRFLELQPDGCFVSELDGEPVGTLTTCFFGPVAWIAMVLVDLAARGRGIGTAMMGHALDFLDHQGVRTVRLDATPLGRPLYEKMGFVGEYELGRHQGVLPPPAVIADPRVSRAERIDDLVERDRAATGTDRGKLLRRLFAERPEEVRAAHRDGRVEGYVMARPGAHAIQVGPCIASPDAGRSLLADAWNRHAGRCVLIDIPDDNAEARALAEASRLTVHRRFVRMCRGDRVAERPEMIWASSGPEMG